MLIPHFCCVLIALQYTVILLGGLSGRLDQTVHTLSLLHKLRKTREHMYAITDENVGWVLDTVCWFHFW